MKDPTTEQDDGPSELDRALEALLTGKLQVTVDPATGEILSTTDGEKSSLTDTHEPPTIH